MSLVTSHFFPVLLSNQQWSPPLTLQASHCSTFRIVCDVPSVAVFCSESIIIIIIIIIKFILGRMEILYYLHNISYMIPQKAEFVKNKRERERFRA